MDGGIIRLNPTVVVLKRGKTSLRNSAGLCLNPTVVVLKLAGLTEVLWTGSMSQSNRSGFETLRRQLIYRHPLGLNPTVVVLKLALEAPSKPSDAVSIQP